MVAWAVGTCCSYVGIIRYIGGAYFSTQYVVQKQLSEPFYSKCSSSGSQSFIIRSCRYFSIVQKGTKGHIVRCKDRERAFPLECTYKIGGFKRTQQHAVIWKCCYRFSNVGNLGGRCILKPVIIIVASGKNKGS